MKDHATFGWRRLKDKALLALPVILLCALFAYRTRLQKESGTERHFYETAVFNTRCNLIIYAKEREADDAFVHVTEALFRLHNALNRFDDNSELARLNNTPKNTPFKCSDELWKALEAAQMAFQETEGAFDVTVGPLLSFWKHDAKYPEEDGNALQKKLDEVKARVGFNLLALDSRNHTVTKMADGMQLDFGGIAKGLALDISIQLLAQEGVTHYLLNYGGNTFQKLPQEHPYRDTCAIANLSSETSAQPRLLIHGVDRHAVSTSSNLLRPLARDASRTVGHIIDPQTGKPVETKYDSVTVAAERGWQSDAFSTAIFAKGPALAETIARNAPGVRAFFIYPDGTALLVPEDKPAE